MSLISASCSLVSARTPALVITFRLIFWLQPWTRECLSLYVVPSYTCTVKPFSTSEVVNRPVSVHMATFVISQSLSLRAVLSSYKYGYRTCLLSFNTFLYPLLSVLLMVISRKTASDIDRSWAFHFFTHILCAFFVFLSP